MARKPKRPTAKEGTRAGKALRRTEARSDVRAKDIAVLHGPTEDGEGARMVRLKEGNLFAGEVRPVREGQDVQGGELVRLRPLAGSDLPVCEVETVHAPPQPSQQRPAGPPRVSSASYRKNWSAVFGRKPKRWSVN